MQESTPGAKILLVDDEEAITTNLAPFLERAGFTIEVAGDGEEALRKTAAFAPQLIVLDVLMPGLDGREVCRRLRQAGNWTPIILLTRIGSPTERAMALDEGTDDYLNKPFDPYELVARIRAVLRRARPGVRPLSAAARLACGPLVLDRPGRRALPADREPSLAPLWVRGTDYLMTHPDEVITCEPLSMGWILCLTKRVSGIEYYYRRTSTAARLPIKFQIM